MFANRIVIDHIGPSGCAETIGLKKGDVIISYDGTPVRNENHLNNAIKASNKLSPSVLCFQRGDEGPQEIEVPNGELGIRSNPAEVQDTPTVPVETEPSSFRADYYPL